MAKDKDRSAMIEFLGGDETDNKGKLVWGNYTFELNKPVRCTDPHIVRKARTNKFFRVTDDDFGEVAIPDDWEKLPAKAKVQLAHDLGNDAVTTGKEADEVIKATVENRREAELEAAA